MNTPLCIDCYNREQDRPKYARMEPKRTTAQTRAKHNNRDIIVPKLNLTGAYYREDLADARTETDKTTTRISPQSTSFQLKLLCLQNP